MYGFLITRGASPQETPLDKPKTLPYGDIRFYYNPFPKFENDHLFYEDEEKIVLLDGVIFNNHELMEARGCKSWRGRGAVRKPAMQGPDLHRRHDYRAGPLQG